ncbi:MAG: hypothetical protein IKQ93_04805, partial [Candidatus Methanomethylophilaceae archaeon]|nr:hypothetical protein [Candidatus Methanomethylophilaceae archaeon]
TSTLNDMADIMQGYQFNRSRIVLKCPKCGCKLRSDDLTCPDCSMDVTVAMIGFAVSIPFGTIGVITSGAGYLYSITS